MTLYKRNGSPYWWTSQPKRQSTQRTNKKEAAIVAAHLVSQVLDEKQLGSKPKVTLQEAVERYLRTQPNSPDYPNLETRRNKLFGLGHNLRPRKGSTFGKGTAWKDLCWNIPTGLKMHQLTTPILSKLIEERRAEGLANNTINLEVKLLQRVWNLAKRDWGYQVDLDTVFNLLPVKPKTRYLSQHEEDILIEALGGTEELLFAYILMDTGIRSRSEALTIRWRDVDMEQRSINVFRKKTQAADIVAMTDRIYEALLLARTFMTDRNIVPYHQTVITSEAVYKRLGKCMHKVINDDDTPDPRGKATPHSLRDTYATRLVDGGITLHQISGLLGHSSLTMTKKYAHVERRSVGISAAAQLNKRHNSA